jgi:2-C-methyl-D-erythritol 2,4-cyclodiphosphate synthase/2-C-methyl-D-erythritol 4-phosphate cytidylyltransferase
MQGWLREAGITAVVAGGETRQASVRAGVAPAGDAEVILVHDAARPLVSEAALRRLLDALRGKSAALLAQPVVATLQEVDGAGCIQRTPERSSLRMAATPQGARAVLLREVLAKAASQGLDFTDEAALLRHFGHEVFVVEDSSLNFKITTPEDLRIARALMEPPRSGFGFDIHRLVAGGPLRLGGIDIDADLHLHGHSDGDAVLHAVIEGLLGAAGLPDIGEHFPDTDPALKGVDSRVLLKKTLASLAELGHAPAQVDITLIAEKPRLGPWKSKMKLALAELLALPADRVAVKARTHEGLDAIGRGEAISVHALVTLRAC